MKNILILEDDDNIRVPLEDLLSAEGFNVLMASKGWPWQKRKIRI
jgi:DNA-binding response OmpR family regulator